MLVLTRKTGESIHIGDDIVITVVDVRPSRIRLGIDAPPEIRIEREEIRGKTRNQHLFLELQLESTTGVC